MKSFLLSRGTLDDNTANLYMSMGENLLHYQLPVNMESHEF